MSEGPLGGPRPFASDKKSVIVLIGVDGPDPPRDIRLDLEQTVNREVNQLLIQKGSNIDTQRDTVGITIGENITKGGRQELGGKTLHKQQYDIQTEREDVPKELVDDIENTVVRKVEELGFNVTGTKTTVV